MKDMHTSLDKLRADAAEAALVRDLATDTAKRELYARLADHLAAHPGDRGRLQVVPLHELEAVA